MKKSVWISLVVAGALVLLGVGLFTGAMMSADWDFSNISGNELVTNTYEITVPFSNVRIESNTADITFVPSDDGTSRVECIDVEYYDYRVNVENGTLRIEVIDTRAWYEHISFGLLGPSTITVYLPAGEYGTLTVRDSIGDIEIPSDFSFESLDMQLSTGDVNVLASIKNVARIEANTGNVTLRNLRVGDLAIKASTGKTELEGVTCAGDVSLSCGMGKTFLTYLTCASLTSIGGTGAISLNNVVASGAVYIDRGTGDVSFDSCDAANITVNTGTGDVRGTLRSDKIFVCRSDTGRVEIPPTTKGGTCSITTNTGDIIIWIQ